MTPRAPAIRHRVDPGDVSPEKAARRLGLTHGQFTEKLPHLMARGFPAADPDTGNYDLDAIDLWRKTRNPHLYGLTPLPQQAEPQPSNMVERFIEAKKRGRHGRAA